MESQGKMLVALSVLAVLTGFSAVGYVAVQQNAQVVSRAQTPPSTPSSTTPDSNASLVTPGLPGNGSGGPPTCTTTQDCIDYAIAKGMCKLGEACPPSGAKMECNAGQCALSTGQTGSPESPRSPEQGRTCTTASQGDFDCNGLADCADLTLFINEFTGRATTKTSDVTGDGKVSLADFEKGRQGNNGVWGKCSL